jgi:hypothetical protein
MHLIILTLIGAQLFVHGRQCTWSFGADSWQWSVNSSSCPRLFYNFERQMQCLQGQTIVMIGDSLTRYQYISLVGKWLSEPHLIFSSTMSGFRAHVQFLPQNTFILDPGYHTPITPQMLIIGGFPIQLNGSNGRTSTHPPQGGWHAMSGVIASEMTSMALTRRTGECCAETCRHN